MGQKFRQILALALLLFVILTVSGCSGGSTEAGTDGARNEAAVSGQTEDDITKSAARPEVVESGEEAKELLTNGNERFTEGLLTKKDLTEARRRHLAAGQKPFAIIVSCSDSRVPPELIFDQALGDIFVVRVAGNVIDDVARGSVEYAVEHLGSPLIVVLGHEKCGAVKATVEGAGGAPAPGSIGSIIEKISPSVEEAKLTGLSGDEFVEEVANDNVKVSITALESSPIVKEKLEKHELTVVGAKYHLESGQVEWLGEAE